MYGRVEDGTGTGTCLQRVWKFLKSDIMFCTLFSGNVELNNIWDVSSHQYWECISNVRGIGDNVTK